jgi:hypothetical protein
MTTLAFDLAPSPESGPRCAHCAGPTRLIGIEPHPTKAHTDLRTYQCIACEHMQAATVPVNA